MTKGSTHGKTLLLKRTQTNDGTSYASGFASFSDPRTYTRDLDLAEKLIPYNSFIDHTDRFLDNIEGGRWLKATLPQTGGILQKRWF
jgi:hypothetical protein